MGTDMAEPPVPVATTTAGFCREVSAGWRSPYGPQIDNQEGSMDADRSMEELKPPRVETWTWKGAK